MRTANWTKKRYPKNSARGGATAREERPDERDVRKQPPDSSGLTSRQRPGSGACRSDLQHGRKS